MESTITGAVESVQGRQVDTKYGTRSVFTVVIDGKRYDCWKSDVAEAANRLSGSTVTATYRTEQKGDYTNYVLLGVEPSTGASVAAGGSTEASSTIPVTTAPSGMSPKREQKIVRQSSMATAFNYAASAGLSEDEAFALAGRIYARAMGISGSTNPDVEGRSPAHQTLDETIQEVGVAAAVAPATETNDGVAW